MLGMYEYPFIKEGQPGSELFTFVVKADDLVSFAKVERFNETEEGVQRMLNIGHVQQLAEFMRRPDASLPEPILGDLRGAWEIDGEKHVLRRQDKSTLLIDDGQHCFAALHLLTVEERGRWEFKVTATVNTPYQTRLKRFIQQLNRLKLDTQLVLQIRDRGDLFPDQISKASYQLAKRLATETTSPLHGIIRLEERQPKRQATGVDADKLAGVLGLMSAATTLREETLSVINVTGILRDLHQVTASVHSLLRHHNQEQQFLAICHLLSAAKEKWPTEWNDPKSYFLRRSDGIASLIELFVVGQAFKSCLSPEGTRWNRKVTQRVITTSPETIKRTLGYIKRYDWSFAQYRTPGTKFPRAVEISRQLDALIYQGVPKSLREKKGETASVGA